MRPIQQGDTIRRGATALFSQIGTELVLMNPQLGEYYTLDPVAADVWQRLEAPIEVADLLRELVAHYRGEPDVIRAETLALLEDFAQKDLIEIEG